MQKAKRRMCAVLIAAAGVFCLSPAAYADEFAVGLPLPEWEQPAAQDGCYRMAFQAGDEQWVGVDRGVKLLKSSLQGDWIIETRSSYCSAPINGSWQNGLTVYLDSDNWILWGQQSGTEMKACGIIDGLPEQFGEASGVYPYLRIQKSGMNYRFLYSADGTEWMELGKTCIVSSARWDSAEYGFLGREWGKPEGVYLPADYARFDYFYEMKSS